MPESPSSIAGVGDGDHRGQGQRAVATAPSPTILRMSPVSRGRKSKKSKTTSGLRGAGRRRTYGMQTGPPQSRRGRTPEPRCDAVAAISAASGPAVIAGLLVSSTTSAKSCSRVVVSPRSIIVTIFSASTVSIGYPERLGEQHREVDLDRCRSDRIADTHVDPQRAPGPIETRGHHDPDAGVALVRSDHPSGQPGGVEDNAVVDTDREDVSDEGGDGVDIVVRGASEQIDVACRAPFAEGREEHASLQHETLAIGRQREPV